MADIATISAMFSSVKTATEIAKLIKDGALANIKIELSEVRLTQREEEKK